MKNLQGIFLMIVAMIGFSVEDLFIKLLSSTISTSQILITLGVCGAVVFAALARFKGQSLFTANAWTTMMVLRACCEAFAALAFVTSLSLVPISTVAAVFQVTPLVITMGAALFLGEQVGWRRWSAIIVGLVGVLIIIRPGLSGFDPTVLIVLISVLFAASRDLVTRRIPETISSSVISFQAFASSIVAGTLLLFFRGDPLVSISSLETAYFAGGVLFGVVGYYGIVASMRIGDASVVTPFRYSRLLFSIVIGVLVFEERPDTLTLIGSAIVVGTGLYTFVREQRVLFRS